MSIKWVDLWHQHFYLVLIINTCIATSIASPSAPVARSILEPSKVPDPLQKAVENPNIKPPNADVAEEEQNHGPLSQILLAPIQASSAKSLKKRSPTYCVKCSDGGGGGGGSIGGFFGGFRKSFGGGGGYGGGYGGGGGGGAPFRGGGGCGGGGCGGGGYPGGGGGGYYPGGGGGGGYYPGGGGGGCGGGGCGGGGGCKSGGCGGGGGGSYASASASAQANSYGK